MKRYGGSKNFSTAREFVLAHPENAKDQNGCINFGGSVPTGRYGQVWFHGRMYLAHRAIMGDDRGLIPRGMFVCHTCDNPRCVNPEHLYIGTPTQNALDRESRNRSNSPRGEQHALAKLTEEKVIQIFFESGPQSAIAKKYGIVQATVCKIKNKQRWAHVLNRLD